MSQAHSSPSEFPAPSHPYGLHLQSTDVLGMGMGDNYFSDSTAFMNMDTEMTTSTTQNTSLPPYFYPERAVRTTTAEQMSQGISPMMTVGEITPPPTLKSEAPAPTMNRPPRAQYWPGSHQQMAYQAEVQAQQKLAQQKAAAAAVANAPKHPQQAKIDSFLDSFKSPPAPLKTGMGPADVLPHIARLKKEEEEMDDDERLLASEEGKKLSSKERRQLRNKVSARAFRSRRKEYITQLEAEVAKKSQEAAAAKDLARRTEEENARLRGFTEMLMKHAAFQEFINDMTSPPREQPQQPAPVPSQAEQIPTFNPTRDLNPNAVAEDQWPLAYSNWPTANTNNTQHVFAMQLPETAPAIQSLDGKVLPYEEEALEEDYSICDGFFSSIRNSNADVEFTRLSESDNSPPENIEDLLSTLTEEKEEVKKQNQNLDDLFPGVQVNSFLERLEMVAGGQARPEDVFELEPQPQQQQPQQQQQGEHVRCSTSNKMLKEAEGVYRRIGLAVGGS